MAVYMKITQSALVDAGAYLMLGTEPNACAQMPILTMAHAVGTTLASMV